MGVEPSKNSLTKEQWEALQADFGPKQIGKLPKPYKSDSPKGNCPVCKGYHGLPAAHLDYVGHAVITARLNGVDPDWNWRPMGVDAFGNPVLDAEKNLWIWLTIGGKTIPAVGDGKNMKERIGDAIRNGAMRFGVALDLWAKEELEDFSIERGDNHPDKGKPAPSEPTSLKDFVATEQAGEPVGQTPDGSATKAERDAIVAQARYYGFKTQADKASVVAVLSKVAGREITGTADRSITSAEAVEMAERFTEVADALAQAAIANGMGGVAE